MHLTIDTKYTKNLSELNKDSLLEAGGKGANLGELIYAGLPVPPGFVVTTKAYRAHLKGSGLYERISERLAQLKGNDILKITDISRDISLWIQEAHMPVEVQKAVKDNIGSLAEKSAASEKLFVAVRSSATAEDLPSASFAGQHDTFLGIYGIETVLEHVKKCWLSLWTPQAISYRISMGFEHLKVDLAVVVQTMVDSDVAGVMFTANPVSGDKDELLISAGYGLGEAVVSGIITPDTFIMTKDGQVKEKLLGSKDKKIVLSDNGTLTETVPQTMQNQFCLGTNELVQLANLATLVEKHYGSHQDIEWASYNKNIYLLQARPITTLKSENEDLNVLNPGDEIIYKAKKPSLAIEMAMERFSEPMVPLDFACLEQRIKAFGFILGEWGLKVPEIRLIERESGCVAIGFGKMGISPATLWKLPFALIKSQINNSPKDAKELWKPLSEEINLWLNKMETTTKNTNSAQKLAKLVKQALDQFGEFFHKRSFVIDEPGKGYEAKLERLIKKTVGGENCAPIKEKLLKALPFRTALQNKALLKLAQTASAGKNSAAFKKEFNSFLEEYGDRPTYGITSMLAIPTWRERPEIIHGIIDSLLNDNVLLSFGEDFEKQQVDYDEARITMQNMLKGSEHANFNQILATARDEIIVREESSFMLEKLTACIREMASKLGNILVNERIIKEKDDVFYIFLDELNSVAEGKLVINEKIKKRKSAFAKVCAAHKKGIHWLVSTGSCPEFKKSKKDSSEKQVDMNTLRGLAVSSGVYEGTVCIVRDPSEFNKLKKGDIMVSPYTAPVWTPLFKVAAALVTEIGSPTSHAAIIAREYGIPAVVAIENVTNVLKDGQKIRVDGTKGIIVLLSE